MDNIDEVVIAFATLDDEKWLIENDSNQTISSDLVKQKVSRQEYIVASFKEKILGYLRFSYFWSFIPFIDIISVEEAYQRKGIGQALLTFLEAYAKEKNQYFILSSSQSDEPEPQAWHRYMGFKDAGVLDNLIPLQNVSEIIFLKELE